MIMILTDYYRFEKLADTKTRFDCTHSTGSYETFERLRNKAGKLTVYIGENHVAKGERQRISDLAITKTKSISSIYTPDVKQNKWFGDVNHTADALLFIVHDFQIINGAVVAGAIVELFVARGQKHNQHALWQAFCDGEMTDEVEILKRRAIDENQDNK